MISKSAAYITGKNGVVYDVNAEYLFDPKISTYVTIPEGGTLTIISPGLVERIYVISDMPVVAVYENTEFSPYSSDEIAEEIYLSVFRFPGTDFKVVIRQPDEEEVRVFFVTDMSISYANVNFSSSDKKYLSNEPIITLNISPGFRVGEEIIVELYPDEGYLFDIKYMKLSTSEHTQADIILGMGVNKSMVLAYGQPENTSILYDASDYDDPWISEVNSIKLVIHITGTLYGVEKVTLNIGGMQEAI